MPDRLMRWIALAFGLLFIALFGLLGVAAYIKADLSYQAAAHYQQEVINAE